MIVENVEALKSWLAKLLEPICGADPSALSGYVVALVKKDKPEEELKALCTDQLDVFLQKETDRFVNKLFESLSTKNYLETPAKDVLTKETKINGGNYVVGEKEVGHVEVEREGRRNGSPLRIHSDCNGPRTHEDQRTDDRKERGEDRLRKRAEPRREHRDCSASPASPARRSRSFNRSCSCVRWRARNRSRARIRSCNRNRSRGRNRSHGRNRSRGRSRSRGRIRSCGRIRTYSHIRSRGRIRSCSHSRSRSRSWGRTSDGDGRSRRGRERRPTLDEQRKDPEGSAPIPGSSCDPPQQRPRHPQCPPCFGGPVTTSSVAVVTPAHLPDSTTESWSGPCSDQGKDKSLHKGAALKQRCHDYSDKAFYMHGDIRPCDHGDDPLVVEDVTLPAVKPLPPPPGVPPTGTATPTQGCAPPFDSALTPAANAVARTEANVSAVQDDGSRRSRKQESRKWPLGASQGPLPKKPWMDKRILNNQHKLTLQNNSHYGNAKLEVRKIPRDLNNITKLNEHFSAFGTIVNIQVAFGGDPEAALIRYASTGEARRAIGSTEAVLNNRFIQVRWHHDSHEQEPRASPGQSYSAPYGLSHASVHKATTMSVCLRKMTYSSSIMKSTPKTVGKVTRAFEATKAMKKKQEVLKLQQDMTRVKQKMLENQIECQKVLINRLERTRAMRLQERGRIVKMLKELSETISQLKEAVRLASVSTARSAGPCREMPTQKELLGAELDVQKRLISGEDSTDLKKKLGQFQVEKFGDIDEVQEHKAARTARTFRTQGDVEIGENKGEKFKGQTLQIISYTPETSSEPMNPKEDTSKTVPVSSVLLPDEDDEGEDDDDDDEEDDQESRSWRR